MNHTRSGATRDFFLANPETGLRAAFDPATKNLRLNLGHAAAPITIRQVWQNQPPATPTTLILEDAAPPASRTIPFPGVSWGQCCPALGLLLDYELELTDVVAIRARVTNNGVMPQTLTWTLQLAGLPREARLFGPCDGEFFPPGMPVRLTYRGGGYGAQTAMSIPLVTLFHEPEDRGITLAAHLDMPLPPFAAAFAAERTHADLERIVLALQPGESRTVSNYILGHEGCWRPGLGWIRNRFSRFFMVPDDVVRRTHGCYASSNVADAALCRRFAREGVKNLEIHYTYSHLGNYVPEQEPWITAVDDKWTIVKQTTDPHAPAEDASYPEILDYMNRVVKAVGTRARMRTFLQNLHQAGMQSFCYFQPTEAWEFFAETAFPDAVLRHADGSAKRTWYDTVQVDCRPEGRWGQYLARQLDQLFDMFPELDGIFMDQSALDDASYRVCRITEMLARCAQRRGKLCYWNGPYMVELLEHAVGMLAENTAVGEGMIAYLSIGNKVACGRGSGEILYQRNLLRGLWPSAPSMHHYYSFLLADTLATDLPIPEEKRLLHERYMPLFAHYVGKTWVLTAHALTLPTGVQGNIFRGVNGDLLVPLVVPQHSSGDGKYLDAVEVVLRTADMTSVQSVVLLSPDLEGRYPVPWELDQQSLTVHVPWLNSAALLVLSSRAAPALPPFPNHGAKAPDTCARNPRLMAATLTYDGLIPTGAASKLFDGLATTAPLPPLPRRRVTLNGKEVGYLTSRNTRVWRPGYSLELTAHGGVETTAEQGDLAEHLKPVNELLIEPAGKEDFFALGNIRLHVVRADGTRVISEVARGPWSSCPDPRSVGKVESPIRVRLAFPLEQLFSAPVAP